jgi:hypothetical protein
MKTHDKIINQMKTSAEQQNWDLYLEVLKSVVCELSKETLVELLLSYVHIFMSKFLETNIQHQPDYDKSFTNNYNDRNSDYIASVINILEYHKGEPGINNSIRGVSKLQKLLELDYCEEDFVETFLKSVTNLLIIAIPHRSWGLQHPALYHQWLHGTSNEDILILANHYARNPKQLQESKTLLHLFASDIDILLQSKSE